MTTFDYLNTSAPSKLGFGAMRLPEVHETKKMFDTYLEQGFNYFDTAYIYGGSEEQIKEALVKRHARDSYVLANKMPPWKVSSIADCDDLLKESLTRCAVDYFDFYLVHSLDDGGEDKVESMGIFDWAFEQKKKGFAKHVGFSFHGSTSYLARLLERHPEVEFVQLQLNYLDVLRGNAGEWQELAIKHNKPIIVMEPVKGGSLANLPESAEKILKQFAPDLSTASWAIKYAANLKNVTTVLSGMSNMEQTKDNLKTYANLKPMSDEENALIESVLLELSKISSIPCTGCKYCETECPVDITIASCFSLYNDLKMGASEWNRKSMYRTLPAGKTAEACTACGSCLSHCPQHIDIPQELKVVAETFKN